MSPATSSLPVPATNHGDPHNHDRDASTPIATSSTATLQCSAPGPSTAHRGSGPADAAVEVEVALALHNMHHPASPPRRCAKRRRVDSDLSHDDHADHASPLLLPRSLLPEPFDGVSTPQSPDDPVVRRIAASIVDRLVHAQRSQLDCPRHSEIAAGGTGLDGPAPVAECVIQAVDVFFKCEQELRAAENDLNAAIGQVATLLSADPAVPPVASLQSELYRYYSAAEATRQAKKQLSLTHAAFTASRTPTPTSPVDASSPAATGTRASSSERAPEPFHRQPPPQQVQYPLTPPVLSPPLVAKSQESPSPPASADAGPSQTQVTEVEIKLEWQAPPLREQDKCPRPLLLPPDLFRLTRRNTISMQPPPPIPSPHVLPSFSFPPKLGPPPTSSRRQELALKERTVLPPISTMQRHTSRSYWQPYVAVYHTPSRDDRQDVLKPHHPPK